VARSKQVPSAKFSYHLTYENKKNKKILVNIILISFLAFFSFEYVRMFCRDSCNHYKKKRYDIVVFCHHRFSIVTPLLLSYFFTVLLSGCYVRTTRKQRKENILEE